MTSRVIVPIGFESADEPTLAIALALSDRLRGSVELVTVCPTKRVERAKVHLAEVVEQFVPSAAWRVLEGDDVETELLGEALNHPDVLLCLSSLARRSVAESMWGSVSEQLARDLGMPMVLVGPHATRTVGATTGGVLLVPLDGTPVGESMLPSAFKLAKSLRLDVRLVQVIDPDDLPVSGQPGEVNYLHNVAKTWDDYDHNIDYDVLHGRNPARAIVDHVESHDEVVLVAMATRGMPVPGRLFYPSTTFSVLRHSPTPVVVLHPVPSAVVDAPQPMVVVGLDDVETSRAALLYAAEEADRRAVPLRIVHAWSEIVAVGAGRLLLVPSSIRDETENREASDVVAAIEAVHERFPMLECDTVIGGDTVARLIAMSSKDAELVVVGRHRSSRLVDALLGSTSDNVSHRVTCPVVSIACPS
jgi:nucleotide-binding universal stress UspA family protein